MGYGGGGGGGSGGSGGGGGYRTVGGGSAFGGSDEQELPSYNQAPAGSIRFNTDSKKLEVYILSPVGYGTTPNGIWMEVDGWSPELQTGGTRAIFFGGYEPATVNTTRFINVSTTGDTSTFGTLSLDIRRDSAACASRTRGVCAAGANVSGSASQSNHIEFVTIASTGNSTDFSADLTNATRALAGLSNQTRGLFAGGYTGPNNSSKFNTIDSIEIASTGTRIDFGDLAAANCYVNGCASPTKGLFVGGYDPANTSNINYVHISTQGNVALFGDLTTATKRVTSLSNATRGILGGGQTPGNTNTIEYITIETHGDALEFGDLTVAGRSMPGGASPTRAVFGPGGNRTTTMDYVQISTRGDAVDFGDSPASTAASGCSNGHGGLGN